MVDFMPKKENSGSNYPRVKISKTSPSKSKGYNGKTTHLSPPSSTPLSPRRRRTINKAIEKLDRDYRLPPGERVRAIRRIKGAKQPAREAQRIIEHRRKKAVQDIGEDQIGLSDVQQIRVRIIRRDHGIWPPHEDYLGRMERMVAVGEMERENFKRMAATVLKSIPQSLSKEFRKAEERLHRTGKYWGAQGQFLATTCASPLPRNLAFGKPWKKPDHPYPSYDQNDPALESLLEIPDFLRCDKKANLIACKLIDASDESGVA